MTAKSVAVTLAGVLLILYYGFQVRGRPLSRVERLVGTAVVLLGAAMPLWCY